MRSERFFSLLLRLFPASFRARFGDDMAELFHDQLAAARRAAGRRGVLGVWIRTLPSFLRSAGLERWDALREPARPSVRSASMFDTLAGDLTFAIRMLRKSPVFTAVAILVISLGSGAVATIFSAMNAVVLRPLPGASDPGRLVGFQRTRADGRGGTQGSYRFYEHLRDRSRTLDGVAAWSKASLSIAVGGEGHAVYGNIVSGNFFTVLGVRPALGRFFLPDEDRTPLTHPVVVVSHGFWTSRLGADSAVVGKPVMVNGRSYTIVGVAPPEFRGAFTPLRVDAWVPLMMQGQLRPGRDLGEQAWLWLFGRRKAGATEEAVRRELTALTASRPIDGEPSWARDYQAIRVSPMTGLPDDARQAFLGFGGLLLGAAVLVLLIASVDVASMLSARAIARRREMALRAALGAGRGRLVRQLLTEILVLFGAGAIGGVVLAVAATGALERLPIPTDQPIVLELSPDFRVLVFALAVSLLTGLVFGLAPARRAARQDIAIRLRSDSAGGGVRRSWLGNSLIVGQLALSLVLLVAAGLFIRVLRHGSTVDPGFDASGVATVALNPESWGYDAAKGRVFYRALRARVEALAGVTAVSFSGRVPLTFSSSGAGIEVGGDRRVPIVVETVDPGYFAVLKIPIVQGRPVELIDDERAPRAAVINETMARQFWPDGSGLGRTFGYQGQQVTIVGIARDAKYRTLNETAPPFAYFAGPQMWQPGQTMLVRTAGDPEAIGPAIQGAVRSLDPGLPAPTVISLSRANSIVLLPQRVAAIVTGALGALGLLLATVGLYGIISYSAGRRTREIGVRMALGASRSGVLRLIVREGMRLAAVGVVVGLLLAAAATRLIGSLLFEVSPFDPVTFAGMSILFVGVALVASYLPARRAAGADPVVALRD